MKVFISHSWKNKTVAQKIYNDLKEAGMEIWMDANNLLPGQQIQNTIDKVINSIDIIVLVWSKESSQSEGVLAEIYTSSSQKKIIIPCIIDETPLGRHLYLKQIKGIEFQDFTIGIARLKMVLLNYMSETLDMATADGLKLMNEYMGSIEATNHLIYKEKIKNSDREADKDFWINEINTNSEKAYDKLKIREKINIEIQAFMDKKMQELQLDLDNKVAVENILRQMKAYKFAGEPFMVKTINHVENIYESLVKESQNNPIDKYRSDMLVKLEQSAPQIKTSLGLLSGLFFPAIYENLRYYFIESASLLQNLLNYSKTDNVPPVVKECVDFLIKYIKTPGGVVDNSQFGIFGYADDAYFIYSITDNLVKGNIITADVDWGKINEGITYSFNFLGIQVKQYLDNYIGNYVTQLNTIYYPQAAQQAQQQYIQMEKQRLAKHRDEMLSAKLQSIIWSAN